jgi:hypothetical protein
VYNNFIESVKVERLEFGDVDLRHKFYVAMQHEKTP